MKRLKEKPSLFGDGIARSRDLYAIDPGSFLLMVIILFCSYRIP